MLYTPCTEFSQDSLPQSEPGYIHANRLCSRNQVFAGNILLKITVNVRTFAFLPARPENLSRFCPVVLQANLVSFPTLPSLPLNLGECLHTPQTRVPDSCFADTVSPHPSTDCQSSHTPQLSFRLSGLQSRPLRHHVFQLLL